MEHFCIAVEYKPRSACMHAVPKLDIFGTLEGRIESACCEKSVTRHRRVARVELSRRALPEAFRHRLVLRFELVLLPAYPDRSRPLAWRGHRSDNDRIWLAGMRGGVAL